MHRRALIIAVESYPKSTEMSAQLPGTNAIAGTFRDWLLQTLGDNEEAHLFCASPSMTTGKEKRYE